MFHDPQETTEFSHDPVVVFERHALQVAIELARAEGFVGTEAALIEMLKALEESVDFPDF